MKIFAGIGITTSLLITVIFGMVLNGFVLMKLWGWFITTLFDAPVIGISQAIGLALIVKFLTIETDINKTKDERDSKEKIISAITLIISKPLMVLLFGWIVFQFIN